MRYLETDGGISEVEGRVFTAQALRSLEKALGSQIANVEKLFLLDYSGKEVADILGLPVVSVQSARAKAQNYFFVRGEGLLK